MKAPRRLRRLKRFLANEDGIALAAVVGMIVVLTVLSVVLIEQVSNESKSSAGAATSDAVYQAAEAGLNDYLAKLTEDPAYYDHCVAKGESTRRRDDNSALVSHSTSTSDCEPGNTSAWPSSVKWTYPNGEDWWFSGIGDASANTTAVRGYAYNLMITPPHAATVSTPAVNYTDIVSTGCKVQDPSVSPLVCDSSYQKRAVEVHTKITTPAAYQFIINGMGHGSGDPCWGSTIYGDVYSSGDLYVCGATFYGNVLVEGNIVVAGGYSNPPNVVSPGKIYTNSTTPSISTKRKDKIIIENIVGSVSQVQTNAQMNTNLRTGSSTTGVGTDFDDTSASAWRLNFTSDGDVQVWKCLNSSAPDHIRPYCNDVKLASSVKLYSGTSATMTVNESAASFPNSASSSTPIYIATSAGSAPTVPITYTAKGSQSFTTVKCSSCGSSGVTFPAGAAVSLYSGGMAPPSPAYDGPIPSNGAIYTGQDAIISWPTAISGYSATSADGSPTSQVNGRVTVASATDIIAAGDVHYASEASPDGISGPNDDVLGLIAQNNVTIAAYSPPDSLWWRAATIAVNGTWGDYACRNGPDRGSSSTMTFVGTATYASNSGCMRSGSPAGGYGYFDGSGALKNIYRITDYGTAPSCPTTAPNCANYSALANLNPPWFPPLGGVATLLFREVPSGYMPAPAPANS